VCVCVCVYILIPSSATHHTSTALKRAFLSLFSLSRSNDPLWLHRFPSCYQGWGWEGGGGSQEQGRNYFSPSVFFCGRSVVRVSGDIFCVEGLTARASDHVALSRPGPSVTQGCQSSCQGPINNNTDSQTFYQVAASPGNMITKMTCIYLFVREYAKQ